MLRLAVFVLFLSVLGASKALACGPHFQMFVVEGSEQGMNAFDICKGYDRTRREWIGPCGGFPDDAIQFTGGSTASGFLQVGGAWNEVWTRD